MKNLKLTQSLNQKVGIEIEETGLRPGTPGGPTCGQGALACWNCEICKIKDLLVNYGFSGRFRSKISVAENFGNFCFRKHNSRPPPPTREHFSEKKMF